MSKTLSADKIAMAVSAWASSANDPNTDAVTGGIGSIAFKPGDGAQIPTEIYLNLTGSSDGWVMQNLVNIEVFNLRDYGAVGDGVTDDTDAIWACIQAADAAGGGLIYIPPATFRVAKRLTSLATFEMNDMHDIVFFGDGYASKIVMDGNGTLADWYLFYMRNGTSRIKFLNLYVDGANVTNPDPGEQTHLIFAASAAGDTLGAVNDIDVIDCYIGTVDGDGVRTLGSGVIAAVEDVFVKRCDFDMPQCRCGVAVQRRSHRLMVIDNFFTGSDDQNIDFEPTGGGTTAIEDSVLMGNIIDATGKTVTSTTLNGNGSANPNTRCLFTGNILYDGGELQLLDAQRVSVEDNIIQLVTTALGSQIGIYMRDGQNDQAITGNVIDMPGAPALFRGIFVEPGSSTRRRIQIADNLCKTYGNAGGGIGINVEDTQGVVVSGNVVEHINASASQSVGIRVNSTTEKNNDMIVEGNLVIATSAAMLAAISVTSSGGSDVGNFMVIGNYVRGATAGVRLIASGAGVFTNWRGVERNLGVGLVSNMLSLPNTVSATLEGNAGPAARGVQVNAAAGPGGIAQGPVGCFATNQAGAEGTTLWYKESAAGGATDTAGWFADGPVDLAFCAQSLTVDTAARYLAPGMGLVNASTTELQVPINRGGVLRELRIDCVAGVGATSNTTVTVRVNGVATALTVSLLAGATTATATGSVTVAAGDLISVEITKDVAPATPQTFFVASIEFVGR